ncbi:MAG: tetratricopeptide repeat protein [Vicinamibacterales bacterium]
MVRAIGAFAFVLTILIVATAHGQVDPRNALLEQSGWDALAAGDAAAAASAFQRALAADPQRAELHLGAGLAAVLEKRDPDALAAFDRALALDPKMTMARAQLAMTKYRLHDLNGAIALLEAVVAERPGEPQWATQLARWKDERELHGRLNMALGSHFTVAFDGPAQEDVAQKVLDSLERAYWRIGTALDALLNDPVPVVLYTNTQFRDITRSPSWAGGLYDGTIRVPVDGLGQRDLLDRELAALDRVLAHEFTHALTHAIGGSRVPTWLSEGLATAFEDPAPDTSAAKTPRTAMALGRLTRGFATLSDSEARSAYELSQRAARALLDSAGGAAVANLLRDLKDGAPFEAAFEHRIQRRLEDFEADLSAAVP